MSRPSDIIVITKSIVKNGLIADSRPLERKLNKYFDEKSFRNNGL